VLFYIVLACFFGGMLAVFYQTLDATQPKWQLERSLIGNNPGLGFRPMPPASNVESTLIWYKAKDEGNYRHWARALDTFLQGLFLWPFLYLPLHPVPPPRQSNSVIVKQSSKLIFYRLILFRFI
jgi:hypothetical protein